MNIFDRITAMNTRNITKKADNAFFIRSFFFFLLLFSFSGCSLSDIPFSITIPPLFTPQGNTTPTSSPSPSITPPLPEKTPVESLSPQQEEKEKVISGLYIHCNPKGIPLPCLKVDETFLNTVKTNDGHLFLNSYFFMPPNSEKKITLKMLDQKLPCEKGKDAGLGCNIWKTDYTVVSTEELPVGEKMFDGCGKPGKYKNAEWYKKAVLRDEEITKSVEVCFAEDIGLVLYGINADFNNTNHPTIKRLWVNTETYAEPVHFFPDQKGAYIDGNVFAFGAFGKRKGDTVPVRFVSNDGMEYFFDYNVVKNEVRLDVKIPPKKIVPKTKQECEAQKGVWMEGNDIAPVNDTCTLPTKDAGKVCTDNSQCESACVPTDGRRQSNPGEKVKGVCFRFDFGACRANIQHGVIVDEVC
ncbi:MAG: hypothetical protein WCJ84_04135 [Candidatus Peregrinibacteria bacterium]